MKIIIHYTLLFIYPKTSFGQENLTSNEIKRNSICIEAFGQGLYNSFSFERIYSVNKKIKTTFSKGLTIIPHPKLFVLGLPVSYNYLFGKKTIT